MITFIIIVGVILVALFLIVVVYPLLAKKLSPDLKRVNGRFDHKGVSMSAEWSNELNKIAEVTESESPLKPKSKTEQSSISQNSKDDYIKQLEFKIGTLNKQLLGTATVAITSSADVLDQDHIGYFKAIADQSYADVKQADPHSDLINLTGPFLKLCENCKWGNITTIYDVETNGYPSCVGLGYIKCEKDQQEHPFNDSCDKWEPHPG